MSKTILNFKDKQLTGSPTNAKGTPFDNSGCHYATSSNVQDAIKQLDTSNYATNSNLSALQNRSTIDYSKAEYDDCNALPTKGFGCYSMYSPANSPYQSWVTVIQVPVAGTSDTSYVFQMLFALGTSQVYVRQSNNGNWSAWATLIN